MASVALPLDAIDSLIPRSILFKQKTKNCVCLSPDGSRVAYMGPDAANKSFLWVKKLYHNTQAYKVIPYDNADGIREICWHQDSQHVFITNDENMNSNVHLFQIDTETGKTVDLTPFDHIYTKIIAYKSSHPDEMIVQFFPTNVPSSQTSDYKCPHLYKIHLKTHPITLFAENPENIGFWGIDDHLQLKCILQANGEVRVQICVKEGDTWLPILSKDRESNRDGLVSPFIGFPSENEVYMLSDLNSETIRLLKFNLVAKTFEVIAEDKNFDITSVLLSPQNSEIAFLGIYKEKFEQLTFNKTCERSLKKLQAHYLGILRILAVSNSNEIWLILHESDQSPPRYFAYNRVTGSIENLFSENEEILNYRLCKTTPITYTASDGMKINGCLTLPNMLKVDKNPAVMLIHGGPWARDYWEFNPLVQGLANRGFVVLQVNYRGSTGYGKKYMQAGYLEMGGKTIQDIIDGKNWLIKQSLVDSEKIAIIGHSFGGYMTLAGLAFTPHEFACGVSIAGPCDLVEMIGEIGKIASHRWHKYFGNKEGCLKSRSPFYHTGSIVKPLLIIDGLNDVTCRGEKLVQALLKQDKFVNYIVFPDEGACDSKT